MLDRPILSRYFDLAEVLENKFIAIALAKPRLILFKHLAFPCWDKSRSWYFKSLKN